MHVRKVSLKTKKEKQFVSRIYAKEFFKETIKPNKLKEQIQSLDLQM